MPGSINELLAQTLLFTASPKPRLVSASFPVSRAPTGGATAAGAATRKIWEYELQGLDSIRNVGVRQRTMNDMRMPVCQEVKWGDVKVTYQGKSLALPLTDRFLLRTHYLAEGSIPESDSGYWQLPMNLDQSFQRLFGYQLVAGQLQPLNMPDTELPQYMAVPSPLAFAQSRGGGRPAVPPLRVLVCMAFGCAKERNDFEPGGVLGAGRLIPHFMIVSNLPVESMEASVTLTRPPVTPHVRMENEEMNPGFGSGLFTDRNDIEVIPPRIPYWDYLFDYYWTDPPVGTEVKVVRRDRPSSRENRSTIKALDLRTSRGAFARANGYTPRSLTKLPRQGEFDNIHMAPKMKLPASVVRKLPAGWPREVTMAPFCVHDCLHVHWRWGRSSPGFSNPKWTRGWVGDQPYREAGAPMVAPNQDVTLKLLGAGSIRYTARIHAPVAGNWQIVMHHGAAYALSYSTKVDVAAWGNDRLTRDLQGDDDENGQWALFYWHLRYKLLQHALRELDPTDTLADWMGASDQYAERLSWDAAGFQAARNL